MTDRIIDCIVLAVVVVPLTAALGIVFWPRGAYRATLGQIRAALPLGRAKKGRRK